MNSLKSWMPGMIAAALLVAGALAPWSQARELSKQEAARARAEAMAAGKQDRFTGSRLAGTRTTGTDELDETVILSEDFTSYDDWTIEDFSDDGLTWGSSTDTTFDNDYGYLEADSNGFAPFIVCDSDCRDPDAPHQRERLVSPVMDFTDYLAVHLTFDSHFNTGSGTWYDSGYVEISTDGGGTWDRIVTYSEDHEGEQQLDLSAYAGMAGVQVSFLYDDFDTWAYWWALDNVTLLGYTTDEFPPAITELASFAEMMTGYDAEVAAQITDGSGVASAMLHYVQWDTATGAPVSGGIEDSVAMTMGDPDVFTGAVPGTAGFTEAMWGAWWIVAVDSSDSANAARYPADPGQYMTFDVNDDTTGPCLELEAAPGYAVEGSDVDLLFECYDEGAGLSFFNLDYAELDPATGEPVTGGISGTVDLMAGDDGDSLFTATIPAAAGFTEGMLLGWWAEAGDAWTPTPNLAAIPDSGWNSMDVFGAPDYSDDFETDSGVWTSSDPSLWQRGTPDHPDDDYPETLPSGVASWNTVTVGDYPASTDASLTTTRSWFLGPNAHFYFSQWYDTESFDGHNLKISTDDGQTWELLEPESSYEQGAYPDSSVAAFDPNEPGWNNNDGEREWQTVHFDLSGYAFQPAMLRFDFASDYSLQYFGAALDDAALFGVLQGQLDGTVTNTTTSSPEGGVALDVFLGADLVATDTSAADGGFDITVPAVDTLTVVLSKLGFLPDTLTNVSVPDGGANTISPTITPAPQIQVTGTVTSADTPGLPAEGATVTVLGLDLSGTTDAAGAFTIEDVPEGTYDLRVSFQPFLGGFHDNQMIEQVAIASDQMPLDLQILEILPPQNLVASPGELQVGFSWTEPLNHLEEEELQARLDGRLQRLAAWEGQPLDEKRSALRARYAREAARLAAMLEVELAAFAESELDDLGDFAGYRVLVDGVLQDTLVADTSYTVTGVDNGEEFTFAVAADYLYGNGFLVFGDTLTTAADGQLEFDTAYPYDWVEIRPDFGGQGTPLGLGDDSESDDTGGYGVISMGTMSITHFGTDFSEFVVGANGALVLSAGQEIGYSPHDIPDPLSPNNLVAPLWTDLDPGDDDSEDAWFWVDEANGRIVVQWHASLFPGAEGGHNVQDFQVVMIPALDRYIFQYNTTEEGWLQDDIGPQSVTIGIENGDGTVGYQFPASVLADQSAVMIGFIQPPGGTVSGTVTDAGTGQALAGARIRVDGVTWPGSTSGTDGSFSFEVPAGAHTFSAVHDTYWPGEDVPATVVVGETTELDTLALTRPGASLSPTSLELTWAQDMGEPATANLELASEGSGPLEYETWFVIPNTGDLNPAWLSAAPGEGTVESGGEATITVTADPDEDPDFEPSVGQNIWVNLRLAGPYLPDTLTVPIEFYVTLGADEEGLGLPTEFALHPASPNPFNPETRVRYDVPEAGKVRIIVYDVMGREVARMVDRELLPGRYSARFGGENFASGIYFCRMEAGTFRQVRKLVLVR